jgi:hypothetical protein
MDQTVSAFAFEKEVLLADGKMFDVTSVEETVINGKKLILIKLDVNGL